jgi:hypothetical protein
LIAANPGVPVLKVLKQSDVPLPSVTQLNWRVRHDPDLLSHAAPIRRKRKYISDYNRKKPKRVSVLALGHTIGPAQTPGGQVVSAASDRSQARIAFDEAVSMILPDPRLIDATRIWDTKNRIEHVRSRSVYVAIAADGDAQHGKTPSLVLADELHVWRGYALWNALKTGASKTPGSLTVIITTAGERPEGVCWELAKYAQRIAANPERDPSFLPILFAADERAEWDDEALWHLGNLGLAAGFPDLEELRSDPHGARTAAAATGF